MPHHSYSLADLKALGPNNAAALQAANDAYAAEVANSGNDSPASIALANTLLEAIKACLAEGGVPLQG